MLHIIKTDCFIMFKFTIQHTHGVCMHNEKCILKNCLILIFIIRSHDLKK